MLCKCTLCYPGRELTLRTVKEHLQADTNKLDNLGQESFTDLYQERLQRSIQLNIERIEKVKGKQKG